MTAIAPTTTDAAPRPRNMGHGTSSPRVTVEHLLRAASRATSLPVGDIVGRVRVRRVDELRHAICWIATRRLRISVMIVARMLGRDHSTVRYGRDRIAARLTDPRIARLVEALETIARRMAANEAAS